MVRMKCLKKDHSKEFNCSKYPILGEANFILNAKFVLCAFGVK